MHLSIRDFLRGKTILLTGGTGFLGKVIVERLLRVAPEIERIHLLIRETRATAAERFEAEIVRAGLFEPLANTHEDRWPHFVHGKLMPIAGDVSQPRLGLSADDFAGLTSRVDIVINSAASVVFDAPINEALLHNTRSTQYVAEFARACRSALLLHISTAYVAGCRTGRIPEAPLPDVAAAEVAAIEEITRSALEDAGQLGASRARARLMQAGMARARSRGWHDTYTYTKALGEMTLAAHRGTVPTAIFRPTIIESTLADPIPGWIENLNVCDPMIVEYGRGRLADFPLRRETTLDVIPVDFVANALVALLPYVPDMKTIGYYTVGTGSVNPLTGADLYDLGSAYFRRHPMLDRQGVAIEVPHWTQPSVERFSEMFAGAPRSMTLKRLMYLADLYASYANGDFIFDACNIDPIRAGLNEQERALLDFDVRRIDWRSYIQDVHIPGLRRYVLKEDAASGVGTSA